MKFVNHNTLYGLPDPMLLEIYAITAKILHATGMAEQIDKLQYKKDNIRALTADGSTDIAELLYVSSLATLSSHLPNNRTQTS